MNEILLTCCVVYNLKYFLIIFGLHCICIFSVVSTTFRIVVCVHCFHFKIRLVTPCIISCWRRIAYHVVQGRNQDKPPGAIFLQHNLFASPKLMFSRVAGLARHAALRHHAGVPLPSHGQPVRETHALLLVETSGNQQHSVGFRPSWADFQGDTEVAANK